MVHLPSDHISSLALRLGNSGITSWVVVIDHKQCWIAEFLEDPSPDRSLGSSLAVALADAERCMRDLTLFDAPRVPVQQQAPDDAHLGLALADHYPPSQDCRWAGPQGGLDIFEVIRHLSYGGGAILGADNGDVPGMECLDMSPAAVLSGWALSKVN